MKKWKIILPSLLAALPVVGLVGCSKEQFILLNVPLYSGGDFCHAICTSKPMSFEVGKQYQFRFDMYKFDEEMWTEGYAQEMYWLFTFQDEVNHKVEVDVNVNLVTFNGRKLKQTDHMMVEPGYYYINEDLWELDLKGNFTKPSDSLIIYLTPNQPIENLYVEFECD
ncbi:MAG: hypothetical protein ACOQNV_03245 [Mycoplasmoidaceae bacterium]